MDGTSIDTLEEVANQLGLQAEQIMLPADHVLLDEAHALPAIAVVVLPNGVTHFVIVWRRFGRFVELMDPAVGRRWVSATRFLSDLYPHQQPVAAEDWRDYASSEDFLAPLRRRLHSLGIDDSHAVAAALQDPSWQSLAALDAAVRMLASLVDSGAIDRGPESARLLEEFLRHPDTHPGTLLVGTIPALKTASSSCAAPFWSARSVSQRRRPSSPELLAALQQPSARPGIELLRLLRADGIFTPAAIAVALALASGGGDRRSDSVPWTARPGSLARSACLRRGRDGSDSGLSFALLLLEIPLTASLLRLGRRLEIRLRLAFLEKIPRLGDRYFQSRLKSDMAERSHSIHLIRRLPELGGQLAALQF